MKGSEWAAEEANGKQKRTILHGKVKVRGQKGHMNSYDAERRRTVRNEPNCIQDREY